MVNTRSSQQSESGPSSPSSSQQKTPAPGEKRKANASFPPKTKSGEAGDEKRQKTLEQTTNLISDKEPNHPTAGSTEHNNVPGDIHLSKDGEDAQHNVTADSVSTKSRGNSNSNGNEHRDDGQNMSTSAPPTQNQANQAVNESARERPSSGILEKGLIYFFFRGRVGIEEPHNPSEIARSYIVLRPIPHDAGLQRAPIDSDDPKYRVLALPKKVLPTSARDRFMVFVEHAQVTADSVKKHILQSADYTTQTAGTRHTPSATPIASGVYAFTSTQKETHLAYMLTLPEEGINEVQRDIGLREKGSFVVSVKNPQYEGPANTNLPKGPDFTKEILDDFRSLRWAPLRPDMLDYENMQMLLIGTNADDQDLSAIEPDKKNASEDAPVQELERLEGEDEIRAGALKDNLVFEDLSLSHKEYSSIQTTW